MSDNKPANQLPFPGVAIILLALGVYILSDTPFNSTRPNTSDNLTAKAEDVLARLWQDPFYAVDLHRADKHKTGQNENITSKKTIGNNKSTVNEINYTNNEYITYPDRHHVVCNLGTEEGIEKYNSLRIVENEDINQTVRIKEGARKDNYKQSDIVKLPIDTSEHSIDELRCQIQRDIKNDDLKDYDLHILAVMVNGGPYAENKETRIRSRYAVTTGLSSVGYIPTDSEHIGYLDFTEQCKAALKNKIHKNNIQYCEWPATIPYEWFKSEELSDDWGEYGYAKNILVLWLDDQEVSTSKPLNMLAKIKQSLTPGPHERHIYHEANGNKTSLKNDVRIKFDVIGPASSGSLVKMHVNMLQDRCDNEKKQCNSLINDFGIKDGVRIYSPRATLDEEAIKTILKSKNLSGDYKLPGLIRTIATDSMLVDNMLCELLRRGINPYYDKEYIKDIKQNSTDVMSSCDNYSYKKLNKLNKKDFIVLVGEWDTAYSRNFNYLFRKKISDTINNHRNANNLGEIPSIDWLYSFNYLRGLDGEIGNINGASTSSSSIKKEDGQGVFRRPVGSNQFDYLRRLANQIEKLSDLRGHEGSIKAIGVVGSDTYDKLLILQALRNRFPGVVFFTTDLDARMLHAEENEWARNLVVASANGLTPENTSEYIYKGLSFRDSYQTALYNTMQQAVNKSFSALNNDKFPSPVKIFEIGNETAVDYSHDDKCVGSAISNGSCDYNKNKKLYVVLSIALFAILLLLTSNHTRIYIFAFAIVVYSVAIWLNFFDLKNSKEFHAMFTGTSVWPAYILRMAASVTAILFIIYAIVSLKRNTTFIIKKHNLSEYECISLVDRLRIDFDDSKKGFVVKLTSTVFDSLKWLFTFKCYDRNVVQKRGLISPGILSHIFITSWSWKPKRGSEFRIDNLFYQYMQISRTTSWFPRVFLISFIYFMVVFLFMQSFTNTPVTFYTGQTSAEAMRKIMFAVILPYIFLIFLVSDITRLNSRFIELLSKYKMIWPENVTKEYCEKYGLSKEVAIEKLKLNLIVCRSKVVDELIFLPFIILTMLILSRSTFFDRWYMPIQLAIIIILGALIALSSAVRLRNSAKRARLYALKNLNDIYSCLLYRESKLVKPPNTESDECSNKMSERVKLVIDEIENISTGPFLPISKHPIIAAVAMPFGGVGGLYLIDYLSTIGM